MKITTRIRNFLFSCSPPKNVDIDKLLKQTKKYYKTKNSLIRNMACRYIRKNREYKVIDYSKAKQLYESIEPLDTSLLSKYSYITRVRAEYPVKGNRWCQYFINYSYGELDTYKMREDFEMENYIGNPFNFLPEYTRAFRFATKEEIRDFKNRQKEYKQKKKEIEALQKQLTELYK